MYGAEDPAPWKRFVASPFATLSREHGVVTVTALPMEPGARRARFQVRAEGEPNETNAIGGQREAEALAHKLAERFGEIVR